MLCRPRYIYNLTPEVRDVLEILWKRGEIAPPLYNIMFPGGGEGVGGGGGGGWRGEYSEFCLLHGLGLVAFFFFFFGASGGGIGHLQLSFWGHFQN